MWGFCKIQNSLLIKKIKENGKLFKDNSNFCDDKGCSNSNFVTRNIIHKNEY